MEESFSRLEKAVPICHYHLTYRNHFLITDVVSSIPVHKPHNLHLLTNSITRQISDWKEREADLLLWLLSSIAHISGKPFPLAVRAANLQIGRRFVEIAATVHLQHTTPSEHSYGAQQLQIQLILAAESPIGFLAKAYSFQLIIDGPVNSSDQGEPSSGQQTSNGKLNASNAVTRKRGLNVFAGFGYLKW